MSWKQPIPTNLEDTFGKDWKCYNLFVQLLLHACNKDQVWTDERGKSIRIARGQVVFGRARYAAYTSQSGATVSRSLEKLEKVHKQVSKQATCDFTLVSIHNYDDLVKFEQANEQAVSRQRAGSEQAVSTSKSVESVESEKIEKKNTGAVEKIPTFPLTGELRARCLEKLGSETELVAFESYWMEPSKSGKLRYQGEKFFDVVRRVATWATRVSKEPPRFRGPPLPPSSTDRPRYVTGLPGAFTFPQIREMMESGKIRTESDFEGKTTYILNSKTS